MSKQYWLMKSEPDVFSFENLKKKGKEPWDGVRNYQARNFMMNDMKEGDVILYYHSNCDEPGVVGLAKVASKAYPDATCWDKKSEYYDPKSTKENPRWFLVDVAYHKDLMNPVSLKRLKENPKLQDMKVVQKFQRLSVQPVEEEHFKEVIEMSKKT